MQSTFDTIFIWKHIANYRRVILYVSLGMMIGGCGANKPVRTTPPPTSYDVPKHMPEMISIPAGSFVMGDQTLSGDADERPAKQVSVQAFAMSKTEITFKQYEEFVADTGWNKPADAGWGKNTRPVINISWNDAESYTEWLTKRTGRNFKLPSETQWEYAARAGKLTLYSNGNREGRVCDVANIADKSAKKAGKNWQITNCTDGAVHTNVVGHYHPNDFGLYDMQGNVWEWVRDCYEKDFSKVPVDGSSISGSCDKKVVRGGSFQQDAKYTRLSNRDAVSKTSKSNNIGFRIIELP